MGSRLEVAPYRTADLTEDEVLGTMIIAGKRPEGKVELRLG